MKYLKFCAVLLMMIPITGVYAQSIDSWIEANCESCVMRMSSQTGVYILEKGEEALVGRAWLTKHATKSIDVQYFIWSTDNIGILAAEQLLGAAERGVKVRVIVDDVLIDAENRSLLLLSAHPNVHIRIYNPNLTVGVGLWQKVKNTLTGFRAVNQRMHDKTAIFDGVAGITGGRNMADEYFDFDHEYNFRDRDVLLIGSAVQDMEENFDEFWESEFAIPVQQVLGEEIEDISRADVKRRSRKMHAYAADPANFSPEVAQAIDAMAQQIPGLLEAMTWDEVLFISDVPGKNNETTDLGGSGESTNQLISAVRNTKKTLLIQSPYLILPEGGMELFEELIARGIRIRISTNSLASTDNIPAFGGYLAQRDELLRIGVELYEFMPNPAIQIELIENYPRIAESNPVFALHAKSMVIDDSTLFVGTFNLDPRSANLNTEVGVLIDNPELARQLTASIERDIEPDSSWRTTTDFNPDSEVSRTRQIRAWFNSLLPIEPIL